MTHDFGGSFGTHLGQHARNEMTVKFPRSNKEPAKKADVMSRKVARTSTSTKYVSKIRFCNESDILSTTFRPAESTQYEIK